MSCIITVFNIFWGPFEQAWLNFRNPNRIWGKEEKVFETRNPNP